MARNKNFLKTTKAARLRDWLLLGAIVIVGGSSFALIRLAVETAPPPLVAVGRLWVGAIFLLIVMTMKGRRLPAVVVKTSSGPRLHRAWGYMLAIGLLGSTVPFFIFPWAQQSVDSSLAGVYMAFMPIWTLGLAYFFGGESLSVNKMAGFALGFAGVLALMGPDAIAGAGNSDLAPQIGLLFATVFYAISAVLARRAPTLRPSVFSAGNILCAALCATPALFFFDIGVSQLSITSVLSIVALGVFPTGLGAVMIITLIKRMGASFMALANYVTPLWAMAVGVALFGEVLAINVFFALALILAGVYVSQRRRALPFFRIGDAGTPAAAAIAGNSADAIDDEIDDDIDRGR